MKPYSVLFVCMGNICRSPTAHGVFRHKARVSGLADTLMVDSAGTHNYHPDSPPDERSQAHAAMRGYDLSDLRARQIQVEDFETFDLVLVMDWDNLALVQLECPPEHQHKVRRFTEFCLTLITVARKVLSRCWTWWRTQVKGCCGMSGLGSSKSDSVDSFAA